MTRPTKLQHPISIAQPFCLLDLQGIFLKLSTAGEMIPATYPRKKQCKERERERKKDSPRVEVGRIQSSFPGKSLPQPRVLRKAKAKSDNGRAKNTSSPLHTTHTP